LSSDRFAAFAAVAVVLYPRAACGNARHLAIAAFSGTADPIVPFEGGPVNCCGRVVLPAPSDAMANWAQHDGCAPSFTDDRLGSEVVRRSWSGCLDKSEVVFYIIEGGGHTWPGAISVGRLGLTTTQINASAIAWDFFKAHPLPG
jgi:polyhydroxybutyrate depolymerase